MPNLHLIPTFLEAACRADENRLLVKFPNAKGRPGSLLEHVLYTRRFEVEFLRQLTDAWLLGEQCDEFVALCNVFGEKFGNPTTHYAHYMLLSQPEVVSVNFRINPKTGSSMPMDIFCLSGPPESMKPVVEMLLDGWHTKDSDPTNAIYYQKPAA